MMLLLPYLHLDVIWETAQLKVTLLACKMPCFFSTSLSRISFDIRCAILSVSRDLSWNSSYHLAQSNPFIIGLKRFMSKVLMAQ